jgi:hypothetical protein
MRQRGGRLCKRRQLHRTLDTPIHPLPTLPSLLLLPAHPLLPPTSHTPYPLPSTPPTGGTTGGTGYARRFPGCAARCWRGRSSPSTCQRSMSSSIPGGGKGCVLCVVCCVWVIVSCVCPFFLPTLSILSILSILSTLACSSQCPGLCSSLTLPPPTALLVIITLLYPSAPLPLCSAGSARRRSTERWVGFHASMHLSPSSYVLCLMS